MQKLCSETASLTPRLDWLTVIGDIPHIDYSTDSVHVNLLNEIIEEELGIPFYEQKKRRVYLNKDHGIEISFGKKRGSGNKFISVVFKGHAFLCTNEEAVEKIRRVINFIWEKLSIKSAPKVSRFDVAVDIIGKQIHQVFPDLRNKRYEFISNTNQKYKPSYDIFCKDPNDMSKWTGARISNSKFQIKLYERMLTLHKKMRQPVYIDYYQKMYGDQKNVLRVETMFKKGSTISFFAVGFFIKNEPLDQLLKNCLAHFYHHHRIKDWKKNEYLENWQILYFAHEYKSLKTYEKEIELGMSVSDFEFAQTSKDYNSKIYSLARTLVASKRKEDHHLDDVRRKLPHFIKDVEEKVAIRESNYQKTRLVFSSYIETKDPNEWEKAVKQKLKAMQGNGFVKI